MKHRNNSPAVMQGFGAEASSCIKCTLANWTGAVNKVVTPSSQKSYPENAVKLRERYKAKINDNHIFTEDILFTSPSAAAAFVVNTSPSGNEILKTACGISLKDIE